MGFLKFVYGPCLIFFPIMSNVRKNSRNFRHVMALDYNSEKIPGWGPSTSQDRREKWFHLIFLKFSICLLIAWSSQSN